MKEPFISQFFDSQSVTTIKANTILGSLKIYGHQHDDIRVEVYTKNNWLFWVSQKRVNELLEKYDIEVEQQGQTLNMNISMRGELIDWFTLLRISFKIYVPYNHFFESQLTTKGGSIILKNIKGKHYIDTKAGAIELTDVKGEIKGKTALGTIEINGCQGKMDISTSAGTIEVEKSEGDMIFSTSAGTIELEDLVGHIDATSSAGTIKAENITGTLNVSTSAGTIEIKAMYGGICGHTGAGTVDAEILELGDFIDLESHAGSITVRMPFTEGVNLDIEANVIKGATFPNFEGTSERQHIVGRANGGGKNVRLHSRYGRVSLNQPKGSFQKFSSTLKDPQFTLPSNFFNKNTEGVLLSLGICIILTYGLSSITFFTLDLFNENNPLGEIYKGVFMSNIVNGIIVMVMTFIFTEHIADRIKKTGLKYAALFAFIFVNSFWTQGVIAILYWKNVKGSRVDQSNNAFFYLLIPSVAACIYFFFWQRSRQITRKISEQEFQLVNLEKLKTKAELDALQARINPHFLHNSLNSIASLVHTNPDKAEQMTLLLSKLFRYTTGTKDQHFNAIVNELEIVKTYLAIEQVRFEDRLIYTVDLDAGLENKEIPRFLLQPIVENAIKHGISKISTQGEIHLRITQEDNFLRLAVHDNGPAFSDNFFTGYGLQSIQDKLKLLYGKQAQLDIQNTDYKQVIIKIPC
jgi:two-component system, LytTR family, sensor kinase